MGMLIVNADDWGRTPAETDAALACYRCGKVTSVSAMVFMEDSQRAADIAGDEGIAAVGLHLNLSQRFDGAVRKGRLNENHDRIVRYLSISKYCLIIYNPVLRRCFLRDYEAQVEEFQRLYGRAPSHFDGHQHMHLCTNVLLDHPIPSGARVRRSFSFLPGERSSLNRSYRLVVDKWLSHRYRLTDYFFALSHKLDPARLKQTLALSENATVEIMSHPVKPAEYNCLMNDGLWVQPGLRGALRFEASIP